MAKPFIKWVGGKRQLLPEIVSLIPEYIGAYYEPFVGGGALFWETQPKHAVLSDFNDRLIRTYRAVKNDPKALISILKTYPYEKEFYVWLRGAYSDSWSDTEVAAWFIYLNKAGFNGLYRVNQSGGFNVPFGQYTNPNICDAETILSCSVALEDVRIEHEHFMYVVDEAVRGDFVYFDPPYVPLTETSSFTSYTTDGFTNKDQQDLRDVAMSLRSRGVHVLLSNSSAPAVRELYKDFQIKEVTATRNISATNEGREKVTELLIW